VGSEWLIVQYSVGVIDLIVVCALVWAIIATHLHHR